MTAWVEGNNAFFLGAQAFLIDNDREIADKAWFADRVQHNPAHRYIVGRFVESGSVNANKHLFNLEGLQMGRPSIQNAPLNINHIPRRVIGSFIDAELIYPTGAPATASAVDGAECSCDCDDPAGCECDGCPNNHKVEASLDHLEQLVTSSSSTLTPNHDTITWNPGVGGCFPGQQLSTNPLGSLTPAVTPVEIAQRVVNPHIEALAVVWKYYFPEEYAEIEMAHQEGRLFYSMECVPESIKCTGDEGCGTEYAYAGRQSDSYCDHLNESASIKELIKPHFTGGAAVIPPSVPAWGDADVYALVAKHSELAESIYTQIETETPHLSPTEWEAQMAAVLAKVQ